MVNFNGTVGSNIGSHVCQITLKVKFISILIIICVQLVNLVGKYNFA